MWCSLWLYELIHALNHRIPNEFRFWKLHCISASIFKGSIMTTSLQVASMLKGHQFAEKFNYFHICSRFQGDKRHQYCTLNSNASIDKRKKKTDVTIVYAYSSLKPFTGHFIYHCPIRPKKQQARITWKISAVKAFRSQVLCNFSLPSVPIFKQLLLVI